MKNATNKRSRCFCCCFSVAVVVVVVAVACDVRVLSSIYVCMICMTRILTNTTAEELATTYAFACRLGLVVAKRRHTNICE